MLITVAIRRSVVSPSWEMLANGGEARGVFDRSEASCCNRASFANENVGSQSRSSPGIVGPVSPEHLHQILEAARKLLHRIRLCRPLRLGLRGEFRCSGAGRDDLHRGHSDGRPRRDADCAGGACAPGRASVLGGIVGFAIGRLRRPPPVGKVRRLRRHQRGAAAKDRGFLLKIRRDVRRSWAASSRGCGRFTRFLPAALRRHGAGSSSTTSSGATLWVGFWTALVLWFGRHMRHIWDAFKEHRSLRVP